MILNILKSLNYTKNSIIYKSSNFLSSYSNKYLNCGDINHTLCDKRVTLYGWLHNLRLNGNILLLRDHSGIIQLISNENTSYNIPLESVIKVDGFVKQRPSNQINKKMKTGEIEIIIENLEIINEASKNLPLYIKDYHKSTEIHRMKYRYIDLRREDIQNTLRLRSDLEFRFCEFLIKMNDFVNVGTPSLFKSTPGGAREFVVPTKQPGLFYSLIQSPQQHKQLLMVGGLNRYMQLARCYRNEMSRPDRQPEFTQLDIEMSFVDQTHLKSLIEDLLMYSLQKIVPELTTPFVSLSYNDAMLLYGSDRPDTRFHMKIEDFVRSGNDNDVLVGIRLNVELYNSLDMVEIREFLDDDILIINSNKSQIRPKTSDNDLKDHFIFCMKYMDNHITYKKLGKIRSILISQLHSNDKLTYKEKFSFVWIEKFPLFEIDNGVMKSVHHQFTSPIAEHSNLIYTDPINVTGEQFDLVCNGIEIGGGSIRIHQSDIQEYIIKDILKEDISLFSHLLNALKSGAPPHGGFALGNDRLISVLMGCSSIRDVIAFPKTSDGHDLMSGAPCQISDDQCNYYHLHLPSQVIRDNC